MTKIIRHIEKRVYNDTTFKVTAQCGIPVREKMLLEEDVRDLLRQTSKDEMHKYHGESWKFCPDCMEKI